MSSANFRKSEELPESVAKSLIIAKNSQGPILVSLKNSQNLALHVVHELGMKPNCFGSMTFSSVGFMAFISCSMTHASVILDVQGRC